MSAEETEKVDLFAPLPNAKSVGNYTQEDIDFVMKKGKIMSFNDKKLENAYLDWASNSAAACNAWIMAYSGFESKILTKDELNMIHIATSLYNDCNFCIEKHIEFGYKYLGLSLKGIEMARKSLPVKMVSADKKDINDNDEKNEDSNNEYDKDWSQRYDNIMKATYFIMSKNGKLNDQDRTYLKDTFKLTKSELTEMAFNIGLMVMANYMNHVIGSEWKEKVCFNPKQDAKDAKDEKA